jgi:fructose-1,6-bisphosphatase/sedoheptulose 1,7-bisphosphatase-like protein
MKRAKIAVSALAVLAIAGTGFAFRAHQFINKKLYVGATAAGVTQTKCTVISSVTITTAANPLAKKAFTSAYVSGDPSTTLCNVTTFTTTISDAE